MYLTSSFKKPRTQLIGRPCGACEVSEARVRRAASPAQRGGKERRGCRAPEAEADRERSFSGKTQRCRLGRLNKQKTHQTQVSVLSSAGAALATREAWEHPLQGDVGSWRALRGYRKSFVHAGWGIFSWGLYSPFFLCRLLIPFLQGAQNLADLGQVCNRGPSTAGFLLRKRVTRKKNPLTQSGQTQSFIWMESCERGKES